jgi:hypothetical protein
MQGPRSKFSLIAGGENISSRGGGGVFRADVCIDPWENERREQGRRKGQGEKLRGKGERKKETSNGIFLTALRLVRPYRIARKRPRTERPYV